MAEPICYSPHKREEYTVEIHGRRWGIGAHPAVANAPVGVWNIVWLTTKAMDAFLTKAEPDAMSLPYTSSFLPLAVAMAYQEYEDGRECWTLAEKVPPAEFIETIKKSEFVDDLILPMLLGDTFWGTAQERAEEYSAAAHMNVVVVNFGRG